MPLKLPIYIAFLFLIGCNHSKSTKTVTNGSKDAGKDISTWLSAGLYQVDIMDMSGMPAGMQALALKIQRATQENYEWFVDYVQKVPPGEPLPYHKNFGVSEEEYKQFLQSAEKIEVHSSGKENLVIKQNNSTIHFDGNGRLSVFDSIRIDLLKNTGSFGTYNLDIMDSINITDDDNGLRSKWRGYSFRFEQPENPSAEKLKDIENLDYVLVKLTVGKLEKNNKTLLDLTLKEIQNGEKIRELRLPLVF